MGGHSVATVEIQKAKDARDISTDEGCSSCSTRGKDTVGRGELKTKAST